MNNKKSGAQDRLNVRRLQSRLPALFPVLFAFPHWDISPLREVGERSNRMRVSHAVKSNAGRRRPLMIVTVCEPAVSKGAPYFSQRSQLRWQDWIAESYHITSARQVKTWSGMAELNALPFRTSSACSPLGHTKPLLPEREFRARAVGCQNKRHVAKTHFDFRQMERRWSDVAPGLLRHILRCKAGIVDRS